jgi:hypothetical protein
VISKSPPRPAPAEDAFAGGLRGRQLAHFELIEPIGVGGMAAVIRARDTQLDREVALKILPPEMAADPENVRRFHQEARSAAKLDHETIARVFYCGEDQRLHFIAFEFVEGENLRSLIEKRGRLPAAEAVSYMLQIAGGLAHAAARSVVHRDIKPSNIIISPGGKAKLVDMGLARSLERSHDDGLTQSGVTLGTFDYISPEQALEPREADARSDIYSLGCTFYHALTGQPPVPEGTAAKKLHHHHHVKPADPRELAADLPNSVAAILGRMMAKRPADRYQSARELGQHLLAAARELGANPEVPEGVPATVEPRPAPLVRGPFVLAGLAVAVVGLVLLTEPGGPAPTGGLVAVAPGTEDAGKGPAEPREPPKETVLPKPILPPPADRRPATPAALVYDGPADAKAIADWADGARAKGVKELEIRLAGNLTLEVDDPRSPCPSLRAAKVTVRPKTAGQRPMIKLSHKSPNQQQAWAALTVEGDDVTVEGIRFWVDALGGSYKMVGLRLVGPGRHRVKDCEFVQVTPTFDPEKRLASVLAESAGSSSLHLEGCCFLGYGGFDEVTQPGMDQPPSLSPYRAVRGGQDAVVRHGPVRLEAVNCAFGPHAADFRFEGAPTVSEDRRADVRHCSFLAAADSAAFDVTEGASVDLRVEGCLFSRPPDAVGGMGTGGRAVLLRQVASTGSPVVFRGRDNRYHNLDGFWLTGDDRPVSEANDFARKLQEAGGSDLDARSLESSPWKGDRPLKLLEQSDRPEEAFRPNDQLAALRVPGAAGRQTVAGVERIAKHDFAAGLRDLPAERTPPLALRERVVDPIAEDDPDGRVYRRLEDAVLAAKPGDVILIRHQGRLAVGSVRLDKRAADLTLRPAAGYRPELTPSDSAGAALFDVRDGQLRLEDLSFRLQPGDETRSLALVALAGAGQCTIKRCVVTLEPADTGPAPAVATVSEPEGGTEERPQLALEGCLIRGRGDVVRDRSGRPFELKARHTIAVLAGSFLSVESGAEAAPPGQSIRATLGKVTAYLTQHLVRLQAGREQRGPVPVECEARECIFVAASDKSLVHLDGPETGEDRLRERLTWTGEGNVYGNLKDRMFDQMVPGDEMAMSGPTLGAERWKSLFKEDGNSQFLPAVQFDAAPPAEGSFFRVKREQMRPRVLKEVGAEVSVPMPAADGR